MDAQRQVREELTKASGNGNVKKRVTLWQLVERRAPDRHGRIQVHRGKEGRDHPHGGAARLAKGWNVQTLICDATGDAELLRAIWPELETDESVQAGSSCRGRRACGCSSASTARSRNRRWRSRARTRKRWSARSKARGGCTRRC